MKKRQLKSTRMPSERLFPPDPRKYVACYQNEQVSVTEWRTHSG